MVCTTDEADWEEQDEAPTTQDGVPDPMVWPLELGETLVVHHPHSGRPPEVIPTRELNTFRGTPTALKDSIPSGDSRPPYFPFKTLADFEQTELFVKRDQTDPHINEQLDLWKRHGPGAGVTLKNAREMHKCLEDAGIEGDLSQVKSQQHALHDELTWLLKVRTGSN